ncbi:uncharacterized protein Eint_101450 [Encephalitozoon intestinalis ATCC 50506]|uniref:Uncharacterized protein n=1 Tax=Encephalitozoon intestinalis (strain ATCC 50506) TaxID=876142 RepID=E0S9T5_ENCIT|nr:uncharacterized protein Eint_101450 [Encephalitozoon intestinalis ATCC 50506]ADM12470.2 hypothetical protein Eint_101450 [Encephalitozoon intestinalis ATCC 50506]UTX46307.1 hypothetical protein GPK93_10g19070 [Encephalitozoon intestinalis]
MDGLSGKDKDKMSGKKEKEVGTPISAEGSNGEGEESFESDVMKHVIGAACMLSHKSSDEDVTECSEEKISTFDVYIVNEDGKVNGYELKHIGPAGGVECSNSPQSSPSNEMIRSRSFHFDRKNKGLPPQEFYRRKKSSEQLPWKINGNCSNGSKEKCEPIILEISEISDGYSVDGTDEHQDINASVCSQDTGSSKISLKCENETSNTFVDLNFSNRQETSEKSDCRGLQSDKGSQDEILLPFPSQDKDYTSSGSASPESRNGPSRNSDLEKIALSIVKITEPGESGKEKEHESDAPKAMGNIIKAIQAQESEDKLVINQKIGLNSPCPINEEKCLGEDAMMTSEDLSRELKTALLAAFIPSMETSEMSETSEKSFVETSITRNIGGKPDSTEEVEKFRTVLNIGDSVPPLLDVKDLAGKKGKDDEMIIFVEAEDIGKKRNVATRNNRVGRLVKFFESLEERNKERDPKEE